MDMNLYQIWDVVSEDVGPVFEAKNHDVAIRQVVRLCKGQNMDFGDLKLYWVGTRGSSPGVTSIDPEVIPVVVRKE